MAPMSKNLYTKHISDIHVKSSEEYLEKYNREVLLDSLWKDIKNRSEIDESLKDLDFAFITGDLAFSGDDSESNDEFQEVVKTIINPPVRVFNFIKYVQVLYYRRL